MLLIANWILFVCLVILTILAIVVLSRGAFTLESVCLFLVYLTAAIIVGVPLIHG